MKRTHGSAVCRSWPWTWAVGLSVGLLLGAAVVALAAAYVLYSILTLP